MQIEVTEGTWPSIIPMIYRSKTLPRNWMNVLIIVAWFGKVQLFAEEMREVSFMYNVHKT